MFLSAPRCDCRSSSLVYPAGSALTRKTEHGTLGPAGEGEKCHEGLNQVCAEGLECVSATGLIGAVGFGTCKQPEPAPTPGQEGDVCHRQFDRDCAAGLECIITGAKFIGLGKCTKPGEPAGELTRCFRCQPSWSCPFCAVLLLYSVLHTSFRLLTSVRRPL